MLKRREKKAETEKRSLTERFVYAVLVVMIIILILMTASLYLINYNLTSETITFGVESTLLSTGIAIIGVAIAVWAGLNIIQVLEKDKLELLSKEVMQYSDERKTLNRNNFLNRVALEKNELSRYVYDKLLNYIGKARSDDISSEVYFELNIIEMNFQLAYKEQLQPQRTLSKDFYDRAIDKCNELIKQTKKFLGDDNFIDKYLKICILEFNFYKGYTVVGEEMRQCFQTVIDGFCEMFSELKDPKKMVEEDIYINGSSYLTVYMLNTIGEAYSKIIDSYNEKNIEYTEYLKKKIALATEYFEMLHRVIKRNIITQDDNKKRMLREVYYRNYGAFLERISKNIEKNTSDVFIYKSKIRELYQNAMDLVMCGYDQQIRYQTFQTWLSFYIKVVENNNVMGLLEKKQCRYDDQSDLKNYTKTATYYVEIALRQFPTMVFLRRCKAFIERDLAIWNIYEKEFNIAYVHIENLGNMLEQINIIEKLREKYESQDFPDKYIKDLTKDYDILKNKIIQNFHLYQCDMRCNGFKCRKDFDER